MVKPAKSKKKAAAAAKKQEMEDLVAAEQAAAEDEREFQLACLEIRIKELQTLNLGLQRKSEYLDNQNEILKVQLEDVREEKDDLVSHLQRCFSAEKTNVKELEDRLYGTHQAMLRERDEYEKKLEGKDKAFEEMREKLNKKIMEQDGTITGLEEFQRQKDKLTFEREELQKKLEEETARFERNYDEVENNLVRYREKVKNESIQMLKKLARDVQQAGKHCLTATVKSAISENIRLQDELEKVSQSNLGLRNKLEKYGRDCRDMKMSTRVLEEENSILHRKTHQYRTMTQELIDRQILLEKQIQDFSEIEKEFILLKAEHEVCPSPTELARNVESEVEKILAIKQQESETDGKGKVEDPKDAEISKLRDVIVKIAIASKCLSQASSAEEMDRFKSIFKNMLVKIFEIAYKIPNLSADVKEVLGSHFPKDTLG